MKILILEDNQFRVAKFRLALDKGNDLTIVAHAKDAIEQITNHRFDMIFLDHDLGGEEMCSTDAFDTGSTVVRWMVAMSEEVESIEAAFEFLSYRSDEEIVNDKFLHTPIFVHTLNPPAREYMKNTLEDAGFTDVRVIPFTELIKLL